MNRNEMIEMLRDQVCVVKFTKVNGESREMACTLNENAIPDTMKPKASPTAWPEEVIRVFDVNKSGWRSFKVDSVQTFDSLLP